MKKIIPFLIILALLMMACGISFDLTPEPGSIVVEPTSGTTVEPTAEMPMVPTIIPANVTCNETSLYLDPSLGTSYACDTFPETNDPDMPYFAINPQYTRITIHGYPLTGSFFEAHIDIYPVQRFSELAPDFIPGHVQDLQALISGGTPGDDSLPFLPPFNAAQLFHAQYAVLTFQNGGGIRYLTEFGQYSAPVNNQDMSYTFQGLTSDGQYWISAIFPASHPMLPANAQNPPNGQSWEDFSNNYVSYIADMKIQLDSQSWDSYLPKLGMLDDLIASIKIQP
jgi:hypothetical protein